MQHADRVDQVEGCLGQRQVEEVGLEDQDLRQKGTQCGGLRDRRTQINADDLGAGETGQASIPAAAATGVEHQTACQIAGRKGSLDLERRLVFLGPRHVVTVPLSTETGCVGIRMTRQPGNPVDDRYPCRTAPAGQLPWRIAHDLQMS